MVGIKHFLIDEGDLIIASSGIKVEYLDKKVAFIKKREFTIMYEYIYNKI